MKNENSFVSMSYELNRNFRVKVGRLLVGWSGLVLRVGYDRAVLYLSKALRSKSDVKRFKCQSLGVYVSFYVK